MGAIFAKLTSYWAQHEVRVLMVGLDAAGKTTILYKLKLGDVVTTIPTIGFNVETLEYKRLKMTVWDIGGQDKIRVLWRHYYTNTQGVIFVVDSCDRTRLEEAKQELHKTLDDIELQGVPIMIYANKQDLPGAVSVSEMSDALSLHNLKSRQWLIQPCTATVGNGLYEGLDWLSQIIHK
eukprot:TRINITY_DN2706_c0_g1_i1.p1 TRINITY_DN2706_c0_g1~~TRINITY_DN2706_c0_g1_i1.p1  ORF type:complete len:179 (-),score=40.43 TRINITY_DN2706_c0_g1_i1:12-548(-)